MPVIDPATLQLILLGLRAGNAALDHFALMNRDDITPEMLEELKKIRKAAVQDFRDLAP